MVTRTKKMMTIKMTMTVTRTIAMATMATIMMMMGRKVGGTGGS
jgi:hypothetical protein